jgi:down-regulator of transcription 1
VTHPFPFPKLAMADDEVSLPKATIAKLVKEYVPDMRVAADVVDLLLECCTEFVQAVSSEANDACGRGGRSTVTPEHVLGALSALGFSSFEPAVREAWDAFRDEAKNAPRLGARRSRAEEAGMTEEEQIALQQRLFAAARQRSAHAAGADAAAVDAAYASAAAAAAAGGGGEGAAAAGGGGAPPMAAVEEQEQEEEEAEEGAEGDEAAAAGGGGGGGEAAAARATDDDGGGGSGEQDGE